MAGKERTSVSFATSSLLVGAALVVVVSLAISSLLFLFPSPT